MFLDRTGSRRTARRDRCDAPMDLLGLVGARAACAFYLFIRVMKITDILSQNVPQEDVQYLAGHSNPSSHTDL